MKKIVFALVIAMLFTMLAAAHPFASETKGVGDYEILINELVKDGVITPERGRVLLGEMEAAREKAAQEGKLFQLPASLKWLEKFKFSGDLRLRLHMENWSPRTDPEYFFRIRARVGFETEVTDGVKVFMGIATTTFNTNSAFGPTSFGNPRSTNVTIGGSFQHPAIDLDFAYAQYTPFSWLTLKAGKIRQMPFYIPSPSQFLWDSDINPEGVSAQVNYPLLKATDKGGFSLNGFFNTGVYIISAWTGDVANPVLYMVQPGVEVNYKDLTSKLAVAYYGFQNEKNKTLTWTTGTNTTFSNGTLAYHYSTVGVSGELGVATPLKPLGVDFIHYAGLLGEYVYNSDPPVGNQGFLAGFKIGDKSVSERNTWSIVYMYKYLERDAWLDTFADDDFFKGMTNAKGHIVQLQYAVLKHVIVAISNYYASPITNLFLAPGVTLKNSGGVAIPGLKPVEDRMYFDLIFTF